MKFKANIEGLKQGIAAAVACATSSVRKDHPDVYKINLTAEKDHLRVESNGGYIALTSVIENKTNARVNLAVESTGTITLRAVDVAKTLDSFAQSDEVEISSEGVDGSSQLKIKCGRQFQTIPCQSEPVVSVAVADKFNKSFSLQRTEFLHVASRVTDAIGFQKYKPEFLSWILRASPSGYRAACGDGSRFFVYEKRGEDLVSCTKNANLCIYKDHSPALIKVMELIHGDILAIKENSGDEKVASQIVFQTETDTAILTGYDPDITWPDETKFLGRTNAVRIITSAKDWMLPLRGIVATNNEEQKNNKEQQIASMNIDLEKRVITLSIDNAMKAHREIPIKHLETINESISNFDFKVTAGYLVDMHQHAESNDNLQIEFIDGQAPAIVRYYAGQSVGEGEGIWRHNEAKKTQERYVLFFASSNIG